MAGQEYTILFVDDEKPIVDMLKEAFRAEFRVLGATSAEHALELLGSRQIDVVVTDQRMPGMSGTQLLERSLEVNPKLIKIILSAYTDTSDILKAINVCRINHYLVKPVDIDKMRQVILKALELRPESGRYD